MSSTDWRPACMAAHGRSGTWYETRSCAAISSASGRLLGPRPCGADPPPCRRQYYCALRCHLLIGSARSMFRYGTYWLHGRRAAAVSSPARTSCSPSTTGSGEQTAATWQSSRQPSGLTSSPATRRHSISRPQEAAPSFRARANSRSSSYGANASPPESWPPATGHTAATDNPVRTD